MTPPTGPSSARTPERESELHAFEVRLGYRFAELDLLDRALTHSSRARERPALGDNEALEFLGDAVLGFLVADMLHQHDPDGSEGFKTRVRNQLVSADHLRHVAARLGVPALLSVGRSERKGGAVGRKPRLWVNAYEAVLAAVYLDGGFEAARRLVRSTFEPELANLDRLATRDYKTALQELLQARALRPPDYVLVSEAVPGQPPEFRVRCVVEGEAVTEGTGRTKKQAHQAAARAALERLGQGVG